MAASGGISERDLMVSLKVISQIKTHERISTKGDAIQIETQSWFTSWKRWWREESRQHNISTVETILDTAFSQLHLRMNKNEQSTEDWVFFERLTEELNKTRRGLNNLQETYRECSLTKATLDCVLEKIDSNMNRYKHFEQSKRGGATSPTSPSSTKSNQSAAKSGNEDY